MFGHTQRTIHAFPLIIIIQETCLELNKMKPDPDIQDLMHGTT